MVFGSGVGSCMYAAATTLANISGALVHLIVFVLTGCQRRSSLHDDSPNAQSSSSSKIVPTTTSSHDLVSSSDERHREDNDNNNGNREINSLRSFFMAHEDDEEEEKEGEDSKKRIVRASLAPFEIKTRETIGNALCGKRIDRFAMNIVRGGITVRSLGGVSILTLVGVIGLLLSWCATLDYLPVAWVHCGLLALPNCIVSYILLNKTVVILLLSRFETWYLMFNIGGIFVSLGRLFWDFRIATLAYALPNLILAIFLDASPMVYRHRIYVAHWSINLVTLLLTQYLIFNEPSELSYSVEFKDIEWAVPITHVASSCNINMILLSGQSLFRVFTKRNCFVILSSPVHCVKLPAQFADVEMDLIRLEKKIIGDDVEEEKSEDRKGGTDAGSPTNSDDRDSNNVIEKKWTSRRRYEKKSTNKPRETKC